MQKILLVGQVCTTDILAKLVSKKANNQTKKAELGEYQVPTLYFYRITNYTEAFAFGPALTISAGIFGYLAEKLSANI